MRLRDAALELMWYGMSQIAAGREETVKKS